MNTPIPLANRTRLLFCDHLNLARGKYLPAPKGDTGAARFCRGNFGVTYDKDLIPAPGAAVTEGLPDMEARYLAAQLRPGWESATNVVVADLYATDGTPLPMCGRTALKRAVADWQGLGYTPMVGVELEAFAFQIEPDGSLKPYDTPGAHVYGTGCFADPRGFTNAIWEKAHALGFPLESMHSEYDSPQFEFTLTFDHAVKAIDEIFLFRQMAREIAFAHGIVLTFLPKPILAQGGSGVHINFSLTDANGRNAISGGHDLAAMNGLTRACIAGLMHHHTGMAALCAPLVNSYARLKPASMSGYWRNWGVDHRGVTVRVSAESGHAARLEHRMGDGGANPYTLTATVLQAARLGVIHGYSLPPAETQDGFVAVDAKIGLADDLSGALDALQADAVLTQAVGELLVQNHVAIKRAELEKLAARDAESIRDYYIRYI